MAQKGTFWPLLSTARPSATECSPRTSLAGQAAGIKEVGDGIWLVSFIDYDLGFIDLEEKTLQPLENPFWPRSVHGLNGGGGGIRTHETLSGLTVFKTAAIDHSATPPKFISLL